MNILKETKHRKAKWFVPSQYDSWGLGPSMIGIVWVILTSEWLLISIFLPNFCDISKNSLFKIVYIYVSEYL